MDDEQYAWLAGDHFNTDRCIYLGGLRQGLLKQIHSVPIVFLDAEALKEQSRNNQARNDESRKNCKMPSGAKFEAGATEVQVVHVRTSQQNHFASRAERYSGASAAVVKGKVPALKCLIRLREIGVKRSRIRGQVVNDQKENRIGTHVLFVRTH